MNQRNKATQVYAGDSIIVMCRNLADSDHLAEKRQPGRVMILRDPWDPRCKL